MRREESRRVSPCARFVLGERRRAPTRRELTEKREAFLPDHRRHELHECLRAKALPSFRDSKRGAASRLRPVAVQVAVHGEAREDGLATRRLVGDETRSGVRSRGCWTRERHARGAREAQERGRGRERTETGTDAETSSVPRARAHRAARRSERCGTPHRWEESKVASRDTEEPRTFLYLDSVRLSPLTYFLREFLFDSYKPSKVQSRAERSDVTSRASISA